MTSLQLIVQTAVADDSRLCCRCAIVGSSTSITKKKEVTVL